MRGIKRFKKIMKSIIETTEGSKFKKALYKVWYKVGFTGGGPFRMRV